MGDAGERIFGRNFDWYLHPVMVLFTQPAGRYASVALVDLHYLGYGEALSPMEDPSALGDAPYLPFDGMNEYGLAVGMMAVPHAEGGTDPDKPTLEELEMIRVVLDSARDVPEALVLFDQYNLDFGNVPVHFMIADAVGNSAVVEYLDGKPVITQKELDWQVSTNFILSEEQPAGDESPCWRYNLLYAELQKSQGMANEEQAMNLLAQVSQGGETATRWSGVYNLSALTLDLALGRNFQQVFQFKLDRDG